MTHEINGERLLSLYRQMLLIRRFEERAGMMYQMRKFGGFCHLYIGEEAIAVGVMAALRESDSVVSAYRDHGHALARGVDGHAIMAELYGKATGCVGGMGGSMHLFDVEKGFMGGWGIVGGQIPIAAGLAFASKYKGLDDVCVCFFGEGAIHQGAFHETLNMAALWKLPVVYICENNGYAMGTPLERQTNVKEVHVKGAGYEIEHRSLNGQDLREVYDNVNAAVEHARAGNGPTLLEMHTYRYRGHSMSDPANYRTKEEVEREKKRDPIKLVRGWLIDEDVASVETLDALDKEIKDEVKAMTKSADEAPEPDLKEIWTHIYADEDLFFTR